ncbi:hypothetical protein GW796_08625 [archaeon]|nr:hypothetical protein [archaeon]NCQ51943.1 hypothetical protein [archaeon]
MRFYGFGNYYLSSLQQGLQSAHLVGELFTQNSIGGSKSNQVFDWAKNHKTMVLLNGGNSKDLQELFDFLNSSENPYAFAKFHEDEDSLGGALTYVGVVLPSFIYDLAYFIRTSSNDYEYDSVNEAIKKLKPVLTVTKLSQFEFSLCEKLNTFSLAK